MGDGVLVLLEVSVFHNLCRLILLLKTVKVETFCEQVSKNRKSVSFHPVIQCQKSREARNREKR